MSALILALFEAIKIAGPGIYAAIKAKDAALAQRRAQEATERVILEAIAKRRLAERKAGK